MSFLDYISAGLGLVESKQPNTRARKEKKALDYNFTDKKISIQEPVDFNDIVRFVKSLGGNVPLIVNFCNLRSEFAERGLDFVCGAVCALGGKFERIGEGIYFYAPKNVAVENLKHKGK